MLKRRDFIQKTAISGAVLAASPLAYCESKVSMTPLNKKSLKYGMIKEDISILEKFQLVKSLGFDGVEMDSPNELDDAEIIAAKKEAGIEIPGVVCSEHWSSPISSPDPAVRAKCTEAMKTALHQCKNYGGTTVLLVAGKVTDDVSYDEAWERSTIEIKKMLSTVEETGVKIAIENVWNNFLISPMEAARFIDQFDSDMIGWYFDVGNIVRYGWPHHWVKILGHRIIKVDIKDYSRTKQVEEGIWEGFKVKLGDGDADWPKVNASLAAVGYSGWGSAEVAGGDRIRLKEISDRMDDLYGR